MHTFVWHHHREKAGAGRPPVHRRAHAAVVQYAFSERKVTLGPVLYCRQKRENLQYYDNIGHENITLDFVIVLWSFLWAFFSIENTQFRGKWWYNRESRLGTMFLSGTLLTLLDAATLCVRTLPAPVKYTPSIRLDCCHFPGWEIWILFGLSHVHWSIYG